MKLCLAPLAGFTDAPFRRLCGEGGADLTYTEMVSAAALAHGSSPTRHLLEQMPGEGPVACQLFGAKAEEVADAARQVTAFGGFCELNLNAGCPMTKVTKCGAGAKLVQSPEQVYTLLRAMVCATTLPVTLKTRLGPQVARTTAFELLAAAEEAGAAGIIFHARYTNQLHGGEVHLEVLSELVSRAHLPVMGNGSVTDAQSLAAMLKTGVAGVMLGRAALSDPWIFARLKNLPGERPDRLVVCQRHLETLLAFRQQLAEKYPWDHVPSEDGFASVKMHTHLFRYFSGRPGAAALRARLNRVRTVAEIRQLLQQA